jgi:hypothetical protein
MILWRQTNATEDEYGANKQVAGRPLPLLYMAKGPDTGFRRKPSKGKGEKVIEVKPGKPKASNQVTFGLWRAVHAWMSIISGTGTRESSNPGLASSAGRFCLL